MHSIKLLLVSAASALLSLSATLPVQAGEKVRSPIVCAEWDRLRHPTRGKLILCTDKSRPVILTRWVEVDIPDESGDATRRVVIGWR